MRQLNLNRTTVFEKIFFACFFLFLPVVLPGQSQTLEINCNPNPFADPILLDSLNNNYLSYRGCFHLCHYNNQYKNCKSRSFGGLSAIWASSNGDTIIAISDYSSVKINHKEKFHRAGWFMFKLNFNIQDSLTGIDYIKHGQLFGTHKKPFKGEIESVAVKDTNLYITFDTTKPILRFVFHGDVEGDWIAHSELPPLKGFKKGNNSGIEASTFVGDQILAIHEEYENAWLINPISGNQSVKNYKRSLEAVKGAATLLDGKMIILEKDYPKSIKKTKLQIKVLNHEALRQDALVGKTILDTPYSSELDNFEGITSFSRNGREFLLLVSDDNGDWLNDNEEWPHKNDQKTLFLLLELVN